MKKDGAVGILIVMVTGFLGWLGSVSYDNSTRVERHSAEIKNLHEHDTQQLEMLKEMRHDIKTLIRRRD